MSKSKEKTIIFDMESDNLLRESTKIHCISTYCMEDGKACLWGPSELEAGLAYLATATHLVGHNIVGYDLPMFLKHYKWKVGDGVQITDTLVLDCLLNPEAPSHSLANLAKRYSLEQQKVEHEDWSTYTAEMGWRCESDVIINVEIYKRLIAQDGYSEELKALELEQEVLWIHAHQAVRGVRIDIDKGVKLYHVLDKKCKELGEEITREIPPEIRIPSLSLIKAGLLRAEIESKVDVGLDDTHLLLLGQKAVKKDGHYTVNNLKYFEGEQPAQGPYNKVDIHKFNLNSHQEVTKYLLSLGWVPTEWNVVKDKITGEFRKTGPKLTEDSYHSLPDGVGKLIAQYNITKHRRSMLLNVRKKDGRICGILGEVWHRKDKRISADGMTCGTPTRRYRHYGVVNIPRPKTPYGKEIRELFTAGKGKRMLGIDLSGIEAVVLAHFCHKYTEGDSLAKSIMTGDFHDANAVLWGVDRDTAKSILYASMYGAGPAKLAAIKGCSESEGKKIKTAFYKKYPAVKELLKDLELGYKSNSSKFIRNPLDGSRIYVRSKHKLLNCLIQTTAAVIFKIWMLKMDEAMPERAYQIISMHDEIQVEYSGTLSGAEMLGSKFSALAEYTGEELGIKVPVTAEAKIGYNWKETH